MVTPPTIPIPPNLVNSANSAETLVSDHGIATRDIPATNYSLSPPTINSNIDKVSEENAPSTSSQSIRLNPKADSTPIQTFVFLDLETSGLYCSRNRITEFAMLAVSRTDVEAMKTAPPAASTVSEKSTQVPGADISKNSTNGEVAKNRVKRRLFDDEFSEESVVGTCHPHMVDKRLKSLKPCGENSQVYLNDNGSHSDPNESNKSQASCVKNGQHSEHSSSTENELAAQGASNSEQVKSSDGECNPGLSGPNQTRELGIQTTRRSTSHFHPLPKLPRIIEKLSKVFNPKTTIFTGPEEMSGLNNVLLENSSTIDSTFCNIFCNYLNFLPKPICLVGHNGVNFDFPVMLSEFYSATKCQFECPDVFCVDSLTILKALDKIEAHDEISMATNDVKKNEDWFLRDDIFENLSMEENSEGNSPLLSDSTENECTNGGGGTLNSNMASFANESTPLRSSSIYVQSGCPVTPVTPNDAPREDGAVTHSESAHFCTPSAARTPVAVRSQNKCPSTPVKIHPMKAKSEQSLLVFPPHASFKSKVLLAAMDKEYNIGFKPSQKAFSQPVLYERLFGQSYEAHRAERDCEALLRIAGFYGKDFTTAADVLKIPLSKIKPHWITTEMIHSKNFQKAWR